MLFLAEIEGVNHNKMDSPSVLTYPDGQVEQGWYLNGEKSGMWTIVFPTNIVAQGNYVCGKKHGQWDIRDANGYRAFGNYANDKKHGVWSIVYPDGIKATGRMHNDATHGPWTVVYPDGRMKQGEFQSGGLAHGEWAFVYPDGRAFYCEYLDGRTSGVWTPVQGTPNEIVACFALLDMRWRQETQTTRNTVTAPPHALHVRGWVTRRTLGSGG